MKVNQISAVSLEVLEYTQKACKAIASYNSDLGCRERQLLLLLINNDEICRKVSEALVAKVDIISLIERGYLVYKDEFSLPSLDVPLPCESDPVNRQGLYFDSRLNFDLRYDAGVVESIDLPLGKGTMSHYDD